MQVSVIIPIYNEVDNVQPLYDELAAVFDQAAEQVEMIFVDDGSRDGSGQLLQQLAASDNRVVVIQFRRNFGQTAALQAGLEHASGDILVTLDGDLQNDPADIPAMIRRLDEGYDLVHGWRRDRQDKFLSRRLPSIIANRIISHVTGFPIHDLGCTLKVMRREIAEELDLYGEMHRFIPILAHWRGGRCAEMVTNHRRRVHGTSKYGLSRTTRVLLDLMTVKFLLDYSTSPMKVFGSLGLKFFASGGALLATVLGLKLLGDFNMTGNPLLLLGVLMMIVSVQMLSLGLLGELCTRIYYSRSARRPFTIRGVIRQAPLGIAPQTRGMVA